jgi:hypothetical protein
MILRVDVCCLKSDGNEFAPQRRSGVTVWTLWAASQLRVNHLDAR